MNDILTGIGVQNRFLPRAYATLRQLSGDTQTGNPPADAHSAGNRLDGYERGRRSYRNQLRVIGDRLGWKNGRIPSVYEMARICGMTDIYEFFYHGASKAVHSNLHNMGRMVWGTPGGSFSITSHNFAPYFRGFALTYSVWLAEEMLIRLIEPEFSDECALIDDVEKSIWLAMILTGLARNEALPPLVTREELRWRRP